MTAPLIQTIYPADSDTGIPVGESLRITFSKGIDLSTAKQSVVLYGADFDRSSGPNSALWINERTGENPQFLRSPGFNGLVECDYSLVYLDDEGSVVVPQPTVVSAASEISDGYKHQLVIVPKQQLAKDTVYNLFVYGNPDASGRGISSRTVFDVVPDGGNSSETGIVVNGGCYNGATEQTVVIQITSSGDMGTAKYKWYYAADGAGSAVLGRVTSRKLRSLDHGLLVRFEGSSFESGDIFRFAVRPQELLATNTSVSFTTNDGTFTAAPASPSTPAQSTVPSSTVPAYRTEEFYVVGMDPTESSYNVNPDMNIISVTFNSPLESSTITDSSVRVYVLPATGAYDTTGKRREFRKSLSVDGETLEIKF